MKNSSLLSAQAVELANRVTVSIEVAEGEIIFIRGNSGSGKTLLLRALADLDEHQGDIRFNSIIQSDCLPSEWRHRIGYLPGESAWWDETVGDHFPGGISIPMTTLHLSDDMLQSSIHHLSVGEKQRLALLRLLNHRPEVLLLDEPTANLDQPNILRVESLIREYVNERERAAIWVSHDLLQAKRMASRCYEMTADGLIDTEF